MNPLSFLTNGLNCLFAILIASTISLLGGVYLGHSYEKNYYEAKISSEKITQQEAVSKAIAEQAAKGNIAVAQLFKVIKSEQAKSQAYQTQGKAIFAKSGQSMGGSNCFIPFGFIRLWNASATGETTSPASTDSTTSSIDLDTVLATTIENHGKYREAVRQIEAINAAQ